MKNEAPEARKIYKTGTWSRLGESWGGSCRPGREVLGISAHVGAKMGEVGAKLATSCDQDGPRYRQVGDLGLNLGVFGSMLGAFWGLFWHMGWIQQKRMENTFFLVFWGAWRGR